MQTGSVASRRASAIWRRVGSASALRISLVCSIFSGRALIVGGQHTPRSRSGRTISFSTDDSVPDPLTNVNGFASVPSTLVYASEVRPVSEIQDALRERYAAKALQMAPRGNAAMSLSGSLSATELEVRQAEWKKLDRAALLSREDRGGTVTSTYRASAEVRTELERLVAAEGGCCATARWKPRDDGERLRVTVASESGARCEDDCCGAAYSAAELASVGIDATASLGCGNPMLLAELRPGERVLDLGSGAGLDVLLSARRVAPGGHAYGVDMTDEMLAVARGNQAKAAITNATFVKGTIEAIPLPDAGVDVVISTGVITRAADRPAVLREAYRVLGPGGRSAVADMVALADLPAEVKRSLDQWAGCVAGTISIDEYTAALRDAGFKDVDIEITREVRLDGVDGVIASAYIRARKTGLTGSLDLACSLNGAELTERREEWRSIEAAVVERSERDGVVETVYRASPEVRQRLERPLELERQCCAGARWELREDGDLLRMSITAT